MNLFGNKKFYFIYLFLIFFFSSNLLALENKILVKIEDKIITSLDVNDEINYLQALNPNVRKLDNSTLFKIGKNSIIREKVKEIEILKYVEKIYVSEKYLNDLINSRYLRLGLNSKNEFIEYIESYNLNFEKIEKKIGIEVMWNQLIMAKYSNKINIDKEKLKSKIIKEKNKERKIYLLSEILFDVSNNVEVGTKFNEIKKSISNIGFENTALNYSKADSAKIGGKLGWIEENLLNNKIKKDLNTIKIGETTNPTVTPGGFLILKLEDIKFEKNKTDIDEKLKQLIKKETNNQLNQFSNIYFNKVQKNTQINEL